MQRNVAPMLGHSIMPACEKMQGQPEPCLSQRFAEPADECRYCCSCAADEVDRMSAPGKAGAIQPVHVRPK